MLACIALGVFFLMCLIGAILSSYYEKPKKRIPYGDAERWWELDIKDE
jgi:hypothetical protein